MKRYLQVISCCALLSFAATSLADVKPSSLFSDHMVLQNGMSVPVWGIADPGEKVTVTFKKQTKSTVAGGAGKWVVRLSHLKPGGPLEMTIAEKTQSL